MNKEWHRPTAKPKLEDRIDPAPHVHSWEKIEVVAVLYKKGVKTGADTLKQRKCKTCPARKTYDLTREKL